MDKLITLFKKENLQRFEKKITFFIYYILPGIAAITLISAMTSTNNVGFSRQEPRGGLGLNLLAVVLFIKPISIIARKYWNAQTITMADFITTISELPKQLQKQSDKINDFKTKGIPFLINCIYSICSYLMRFRRQLGVAAFWTIITHGFLWSIFRTRQELPFLFNIGDTKIRTAVIALFAIIAGGITSNNIAIKLLKKNWKTVQMSAYIAFFFATIHTGNLFRFIVFLGSKYREMKDTEIIIKLKATVLKFRNTKICKK